MPNNYQSNKLVIKLIFIASINICFISYGFSQDLVSVDPFSGAALINIPIWTVESGSLRVPISITYVGNGIKANAPTGRLGMGWNLIAGGYISRELHGLPDDYNEGNLKGWLTENNYSDVGSFLPQSDNDISTIADENSDFEFLNSLGGSNGTDPIKDTEPDLFYVNVPGLSGTFLFDNQGQIQWKGTKNWKVTNLLDENNNNRIVSFTITTDNGVKYVFGQPNQGSTTIEGENSDYFNRKFNSGNLIYYTTWHLTGIYGPNGSGTINFEYESYKPVPIESGIVQSAGNLEKNYNVFLYDQQSKKYLEFEQFTSKEYFYAPKPLAKITTDNYEIEFVNNFEVLPQGDYEFKFSLLNRINILTKNSDLIKRYIFTYQPLKSKYVNDNYTHLILKRLTDNLVQKPYEFEYYGIDLDDNKSTIYVDRNTKNIDLFGYATDTTYLSSSPPKTYVYPDLEDADRYRYNPIPNYSGSMIELSGSYSFPSLPKVITGSLQSITQPSGGSISLQYELNKFYDELANVEFYGGGLRVKKIQAFDGMNLSNVTEKDYSYLNENGHSSGVLLRQPIHAFMSNFYKNPLTEAITYFNDLENQPVEEKVKKLTVRTMEDINTNPNSQTVGYKVFTVTQKGKGKKVYHFDIHRTYRTSQIDDWSLGKNSIAREEPPATYEVLPILDPFGLGKYPFATFNEYYGQGTLMNVRDYDASDKLLSEMTSNYELIISASNVVGLSLDRQFFPINVYNILNQGQWETVYWPGFIYNRYSINGASQMRKTQTTQETYEYPSGNSSFTTINYNYNSNNYVNEVIETTNNIKFITVSKFPSDYTIGTDWGNMDDQSKAIYKMVEKNMLNTPIEKYTYKVEGGNSTLLQSSLSLFRYSEDNIHLVKTCTNSRNIVFSQFIPSSTSSGIFSFDPNIYDQYEIREDFDQSGRPRTLKNNKKNITSRHYNGQFTKLKIANAAANEVLFSDFESDTDFDFNYHGSLSNNGRINGKGLDLTFGSGWAVTGNLTKRIDSELLVSLWVKSNNSGRMTVMAQNNQTSNILSKSIPFVANSAYKYYETTLNINGEGIIEINISSDQDASVDDILVRPDHAVTTQYLYDTKFRLIGKTTNNKSAITSYDYAGRPHLLKDEAGNILKRTIFPDVADESNWTPSISWYGNVFKDLEKHFNAIPSNLANAIYHWKITKNSDGTIAYEESSTHDDLAFTFTELTDYRIELDISFDGKTKSTASELTVEIAPLTVDICSNFSTEIDLCSLPPVPNTTCFGQVSPEGFALRAVVTGGSGNYDVAWTRGSYGSTLIAAPIGGNSTTLVLEDYYSNYLFKANITDTTTGMTGEGQILLHVYTSDPACESPTIE